MSSLQKEERQEFKADIHWAHAGAAFKAAFRDAPFYLLIFFACFSFPLFEYGGNYLTVFDIFIVVYGGAKLLKNGFRLKGTHWEQLCVVYALYLIYITVESLRIFETFSLLVLIKHFEHLLFLLLIADKFENSERTEKLIKSVLFIFLLVIVYQLLYYGGLIEGIGRTYRLGLPLMKGVSSNPAGFFLGGLLVFLYHRGVTRYEWSKLSLLLFFLAGAALILTDSKTNILALLFVIFVSVCVKIWNSRHRWPLLLGFAAFLLFFFTLGVDYLPQSGPFSGITRILQSPAAVLEDGSFRNRLYGNWPRGIAGWLYSAVTFFIGNGLGEYGILDGTVPLVLSEQGLIGLLLFLWVWYIHFFLHTPHKTVIMLLLFTCINGVNGDTLIVSYRSIQLYLIILMISVYADSRSREKIGTRKHAEKGAEG